jgi:hypothetical protein
MDHVEGLVDRYVALWNEPDPHLRHEAVRALWTEDAVHTFQPPREVLDAASALAVTAVFQSRGHAELGDRVDRAYEQFVAPGGQSFRLRGRPARLGDVVQFSWEMVTEGGEVVGVGLEFLLLAADGRIGRDYQFILT